MADATVPAEKPLTAADIKALNNQEMAKTRLGLLRQAESAEKGVAAVGEAEKGAMGGLQARSGQIGAAQRARGGGGSLAGARQSALSRGIAEGELRGEFAGKRQAAEDRAAQAQTDLSTSNVKLNNALLADLEAVKGIYDDLVSDYDTKYTAKMVVVTDTDRKKIEADIRRKYAGSDAATQAEAARFIQDMNAGKLDAAGSIDAAPGGLLGDIVDWF